GLLWGDSTEESANHSLRQTLFLLRKALTSANIRCLSVGRTSVALHAQRVGVDVRSFETLISRDTTEALERAARLYEGDLLDGLVLGEEVFEEWVGVERERLRVLALQCLSRLLARQEKAGASEPALATAYKLLRLDGLQEPVHRAIMRLHAELGRPGLALR